MLGEEACMAASESENKMLLKTEGVPNSSEAEVSSSALTHKMLEPEVIEKLETSLKKKAADAQQELDDANRELETERKALPEKFDQEMINQLEDYQRELVVLIATLGQHTKAVASAKGILSGLATLQKKVHDIEQEKEGVAQALMAVETDLQNNPKMKEALTVHKQQLEELNAPLNRQMATLQSKIKDLSQSPALTLVRELIEKQQQASEKGRSSNKYEKTQETAKKHELNDTKQVIVALDPLREVRSDSNTLRQNKPTLQLAEKPQEPSIDDGELKKKVLNAE